MKPDKPIVGLRDSGAFSISGTWEPDAVPWAFPQSVRRVVVIPASVRLFWIDWYPETLSFMATSTYRQDAVDADGDTVSMQMVPTTPVMFTPAERWRRVGYRVFSWLSSGWRRKGNR